MAVGEPQESQYVVLDGEDRVLEVSPHAPAAFRSLLGKRVHEGFPGTEALFAPYYERARRTGDVVEFPQYSDGQVTLMKVVPAGFGLIVSWEFIGFIDVMTIEGFRASLAAALDALTERERAVRRERVRESLSVIAGGA